MIFSGTNPDTVDREKAREALYRVIDPELGVNVVDLGLIYEVTFSGENGIRVLMTLSTRHCPMGDTITNGVRNTLETAFPGREVQIELTFDPSWSLEMLTDKGRQQLGM